MKIDDNSLAVPISYKDILWQKKTFQFGAQRGRRVALVNSFITKVINNKVVVFGH